jgi:hypothetical protein
MTPSGAGEVGGTKTEGGITKRVRGTKVSGTAAAVPSRGVGGAKTEGFGVAGVKVGLTAG